MKNIASDLDSSVMRFETRSFILLTLFIWTTVLIQKAAPHWPLTLNWSLFHTLIITLLNMFHCLPTSCLTKPSDLESVKALNIYNTISVLLQIIRPVSSLYSTQHCGAQWQHNTSIQSLLYRNEPQMDRRRFINMLNWPYLIWSTCTFIIYGFK